MSAILFQWRKSIKNWFRELFRSPGKLIIYALVAFALVYSVISMMSSDLDLSEELSLAPDIGILHGIFFIIVLFIGVAVLETSLKSGTTIFNMSDVNLSFVSPISSKASLFFGMLKQMGVVVLLFILFLLYGGALRSIFIISQAQTIILMVGICFYVICCQILSLMIYSFANGNPRRILAIRVILYTCAAAIIALIVLRFFIGGISYESAMNALKLPLAEAVPLFGWIKGAVFGFISGDFVRGIIYALLMLLAAAGGVCYFVFCQPDYYEDVLKNTESSYEMRQAMKQGKVVDKRDFAVGRKFDVKNSGIGAGKGASAFFFKHLREIRRRSRFLFFNVFTFVQIAASVSMAIAFTMAGDESGDAVPPFIIIISIAFSLIYMQMFFSAAGEWGRELLKPYIYLVPDTAVRKLFFASLTSMLKPLADGIICFVIVGIYLKAEPLMITSAILAYASTGVIYAGANILTDRILNGVNLKNLSVLLYILISTILMLPGIIGFAIAIAYCSEAMAWAAFIPMVLLNLIAGGTLFLLSKNMLHNMEANV